MGSGPVKGFAVTLGIGILTTLFCELDGFNWNHRSFNNFAPGFEVINLIEEYWDKEAKEFNFDIEEEILSGCTVTHQGEITNKLLK